MSALILKNIKGSELPDSLLKRIKGQPEQTFMIIPEFKGDESSKQERLFRTMDEVSREAKEKGITPSILEEILNEK